MIAAMTKPAPAICGVPQTVPVGCPGCANLWAELSEAKASLREATELLHRLEGVAAESHPSLYADYKKWKKRQ